MANNSTTTEKQKTISLERTFSLPLDTVWKAWTEPEYFKKWWGPKEYTCPNCTIDFRIGGKVLAAMQGPDGKKVWSTGTYKEIIDHKKIVVTDSFADNEGNVVKASYYDMPGEWPKELLVTIQFEEKDGKTNMKLQHAGLPLEMAEDCIKGWQSSFDKLETNIK
jgi:uncharacterized protein YndB with AHSA1/START domain